MQLSESSVFTTLITDLDNTLWDWSATWLASFGALLDAASALSGVPPGVLRAEAQVVHRRVGTVEYSFLLDELPSLLAASHGQRPSVAYRQAIESSRAARSREFRVYPRVDQALRAAKGAGILIVGLTESLGYWTQWRIRTAGLDGVFDRVYSGPDHDFPPGVTRNAVRSRPEASYGLHLTKHVELPQGFCKPDVRVLASILEDIHVRREGALYVGDSLVRDVQMAKQAGLTVAWARYGVASLARNDLLHAVSHWPQSAKAPVDEGGCIQPDFVLETGFEEILPILGVRDGWPEDHCRVRGRGESEI